MIRITAEDFDKLVKLLAKESAQGAYITLKTTTSSIEVTTVDKHGKEMRIEISDVSYPFKPRLTKTETF